MATDNTQQDLDLERTDRLPILEGTLVDDDVEDDAVRMEFTPAAPSIARTDFPRAAAVDLPSLAESVRSVEERIARQQAEYEALNRSFEKTREGEAAALARAQSLAEDVAALRALLESEQVRVREIDKSLAEKNAAAEAGRARLEETLREAERQQSEARTLQATLAARDAALSQVQHSLGERDAQLHALQREHAHVVPALEERSRKATQLEADLAAARARSESLADDLEKTRQSVAALSARLKVGDQDLTSARRDLGGAQAQAAAYLEQLRTREWRRGFDENLFRELDAKVGAARDDRGVMQSERDLLRQRVADAEATLVLRDEAIAKLKASVADAEASLRAAAQDAEALRAKDEQERRRIEAGRDELAQQIAGLQADSGRLQGELTAREQSIVALQSALAATHAAVAAEKKARADEELELQRALQAAADLNARIETLESERSRLNAEVVRRDLAVANALAASNREAEHGRELLAAAHQAQAELSQQIVQLQSQAKEREAEMSVLVAHLQQARRPIETIEAVVKRLTDEASVKNKAIEQLNEENRSLRAALERTRGALEEREFLIRRLERSESNNANVLGRIQTSIERLGLGGVAGGIATGTGAGAAAAAPLECTAELVRLDGKHNTSHTLARRTRIGRAPGCEMQIESSSVSRHHALLLMSSRDVIIEDLNSTNGVLVNGRKVSRQLLNDGDLVTIGEAQFRLNLKFTPRVLDAPAATATPAAATAATPAAPPEVQ
jgi:chromosome segregation ATPase